MKWREPDPELSQPKGAKMYYGTLHGKRKTADYTSVNGVWRVLIDQYVTTAFTGEPGPKHARILEFLLSEGYYVHCDRVDLAYHRNPDSNCVEAKEYARIVGREFIHLSYAEQRAIDAAVTNAFIAGTCFDPEDYA